MNGTKYTIMALALWNVAVFAMYGLDKRSSRCGRRRISEKTLLWAAALLGGPGALLGMCLFRHKTRRWKFRLGVPLLLILNLILVAALYRSIYFPLP